MSNPLLSNSPVPLFDQIKPKHFKSALETLIEAARQKIAAMKADSNPPTFKNSVVPLESLPLDIHDLQSILEVLISNASTKKLRQVERQIDEMVSDFMKEIYQDEILAARFRDVYDQSIQDCDDEDRILLKKEMACFKAEGTFLNPQGRARLKFLDDKMNELHSQFEENLEEAQKQQAVLFTDEVELAGLDRNTIASLREAAKNHGHAQGWLVLPERLQVEEFLERAHSPIFRQRVYEALDRIGTVEPYDNEPIIDELHTLRHEYATLLGYENYAAMTLEDTMVKTLDRAEKFIEDFYQLVVQKFEADVATIAQFAAQNGGPTKLEPWDISYWANRYKEAMYNYDAAKLSQFLAFDNVLQGFFDHARRLFGATFERNDTYPLYDKNVTAYDLLDVSGELRGVLYLSPYENPGRKSDGAWVGGIQSKHSGKLACADFGMNLRKSIGGEKNLLTIKQARDFFHEGGHVLNTLLGTKTRYVSAQGMESASDAAEFHSMIHERWVMSWDCLSRFARHYKTDETLPRELYDAMIKSSTFFSTRDIMQSLQSAKCDLLFHKTHPKDYRGIKAMEQNAKLPSVFIDYAPGRPFTRFGHLFADDGYAAEFYSYLFADVYAAHGFEPFATQGAYHPGWAQRLKRFHERGAGIDPESAYIEFRGITASPHALSAELGISVAGNAVKGPSRELMPV